MVWQCDRTIYMYIGSAWLLFSPTESPCMVEQLSLQSQVSGWMQVEGSVTPIGWGFNAGFLCLPFTTFVVCGWLYM